MLKDRQELASSVSMFDRVLFTQEDLSLVEQKRRVMLEKKYPTQPEKVFLELTHDLGGSATFLDLCKLLDVSQKTNRIVFSTVRKKILNDTALSLYAKEGRYSIYPTLRQGVWYWSPEEAPEWVPEDLELGYWCTMAFKVSEHGKTLQSSLFYQTRQILDLLVAKRKKPGEILTYEEIITELNPQSARYTLNDRHLFESAMGATRSCVWALRRDLDDLGIVSYNIVNFAGEGYGLEYFDVNVRGNK